MTVSTWPTASSGEQELRMVQGHRAAGPNEQHLDRRDGMRRCHRRRTSCSAQEIRSSLQRQRASNTDAFGHGIYFPLISNPVMAKQAPVVNLYHDRKRVAHYCDLLVQVIESIQAPRLLMRKQQRHGSGCYPAVPGKNKDLILPPRLRERIVGENHHSVIPILFAGKEICRFTLADNLHTFRFLIGRLLIEGAEPLSCLSNSNPRSQKGIW